METTRHEPPPSRQPILRAKHPSILSPISFPNGYQRSNFRKEEQRATILVSGSLRGISDLRRVAFKLHVDLYASIGGTANNFFTSHRNQYYLKGNRV